MNTESQAPLPWDDHLQGPDEASGDSPIALCRQVARDVLRTTGDSVHTGPDKGDGSDIALPTLQARLQESGAREVDPIVPALWPRLSRNREDLQDILEWLARRGQIPTGSAPCECDCDTATET